ncbi:MAG: hypothetical protein E7385_02800 [Ruminococcaceae bacterium]|jgi:hypothetical protein|nr:hypothetical protein [Oscillospiraceae bacterium]
MKTMLQSSLHLYGAYEGNKQCVFKVKIQNKPIQNIIIASACIVVAAAVTTVIIIRKKGAKENA